MYTRYSTRTVQSIGDHQAVFALAAIRGLNQALHLARLQPDDRSLACARSLRAERLLDDRIEGMRDRYMTTQFASARPLPEFGTLGRRQIDECAVRLLAPAGSACSDRPPVWHE